MPSSKSRSLERDLGEMGESTLRLWCSQVGVAANKAQVDKTGWDFLLEFPIQDISSSEKLHKPAIECKVQVKSTDKSRGGDSISLSNLWRLATSPIPTFVLFISFDGEGVAQSAHLVHIGNTHISKILKRVHREHQGSTIPNLHKKTLRIRHSINDRINSLDGFELTKKIRNEIGEDYDQYVSNKKKHLESVGHENGYGIFTFTTEGKESLERLVDVSIGLSKAADVKNLVGHRFRFGIKEKDPLFESETGALSMPDIKPLSSGTLRFKEYDHSPGISFRANMYVSQMNKFVPEEMRKVRLEGDFFDLVFNPWTGSAKYDLSRGSSLSLDIVQLRDATRLLALLSSGIPLTAELEFDGIPKLAFKVGTLQQTLPLASELQVTEAAVRIARDFDVSEKVESTIDELIRAKESILQLDHLLRSPPGTFLASFSIDGGQLDEDKKTAIVFACGASIGTHVFGVIFSVSGAPRKSENGKFELPADEVIVQRKLVARRSESSDRIDIEPLILEIESSLEPTFNVVHLASEG